MTSDSTPPRLGALTGTQGLQEPLGPLGAVCSSPQHAPVTAEKASWPAGGQGGPSSIVDPGYAWVALRNSANPEGRTAVLRLNPQSQGLDASMEQKGRV